ncbi:MAG: acyl-CoA reductase [Flavobacteriaceae bacterium]
MNHKKNIISALVELGVFLSQFSSKDYKKSNDARHNDLFFDGFKHQLKLAQEHNGWFTTENLCFALNQWSVLLQKEHLEKWLASYSIPTITSKNIAIIMAGNIPLVGFHDFLSALVCGHKITIKQSSNDKHLLPFLAFYLIHIEPSIKGTIEFTEQRLEDFDAVIATGSDNTARYFEYYFKNKPSIIRKNRNSVAVLTGRETPEDLEALTEDIFRYYGLGCRSVSKLFVPNDYDFDAFFNAVYEWHPIMNGAKYANNYDYNKAVYLMSEFDLLENGFLMLKEDQHYASPIATLFYEFYDDIKNLKSKIQKDSELIQCVVSRDFMPNEVNFGTTQLPKLSDYADQKDTVDFLLKI